MSDSQFNWRDWTPVGWTDDGHTVDIIVADGGFEPRMTCPGEGKCKASVDSEGNKTHCNLMLWFKDAGMEFFEWQEKPYRETTLPCQIEWYFDGWDDAAELNWRPLALLSTQQIHELVYQAAGAATVPFMKEHPDMEMPTEEVVKGVGAVLAEHGV